MLEKINLFYFLIAFAFGILYVYISRPETKVVVKFPSPYNAGRVTYRDQAGACYKFKAEKKSCPIDKEAIRPQPIIEDFRKQPPTSYDPPIEQPM
jgi:hypothetical protein